jgi:hypothetical protein
MTRAVRMIAAVLVTLPCTLSVAEAQWLPNAGFPGANGFGVYGGGYGPYGGFGGYGPYAGIGGGPAGGLGYGPVGGFGGYGPYGGMGYGPYGGYGGGYGYGPFNYAQQLYQQQASLTQQIFQQQQQALLGQIRDAQGRLEVPDAKKQQMFQQYLGMSDSDKAAARNALMNDYLKLDAHGRETWKQDGVVQSIVGQDLQRLDGLSQFRDLSDADKVQFRQTMLQKYRSLSPSEQQTWRNDPIVGSILGTEWWQR